MNINKMRWRTKTPARGVQSRSLIIIHKPGLLGSRVCTYAPPSVLSQITRLPPPPTISARDIQQRSVFDPSPPLPGIWHIQPLFFLLFVSPLLFKNSAEKEKTIFQVIQAVISRKYSVFLLVSDSSPENSTAALRNCDTTWRLVVVALVIRATALLREGQRKTTLKLQNLNNIDNSSII